MIDKRRRLNLLALAGQDAADHRYTTFSDPAERSAYREYLRRFRRAWKRADEDRLARERIAS